MTSFTLYDSAVPHTTAALNVLVHLLDKMEEHAAHSSSLENLLNARIAPDMRPLTFQVFVACDAAMQIASRCQNVDPIVWKTGPEGLRSLEDLRDRVNTTLDFVKRAGRERFVHPKDVVTYNMAPGKYVSAGALEFVNGFAVPNIYFHIITMYNILRHQGVQIGKMDYLGFFLAESDTQQPGVACENKE